MSTLVFAAVVVGLAYIAKRQRPGPGIEPELPPPDRDHANSKGLPQSLAPFTEAEIPPREYRAHIRDSQALKSYIGRAS